MRRSRRQASQGLAVAAMLMTGAAMPAWGQVAPSDAQPSSDVDPLDAAATAEQGPGEIVVTARRREETLTSAPVAVSAIGGEELENRAIVRLDDLDQAVPQLMISEAGTNAQGGIIAIRGIGVGESNPFSDQAVSFNVDGVQVSRANIRRLSEVDMSQVEVLKGPQALFFGKNSPGGIIVIRTADPTSQFSAGANASYEFVGDVLRGDGYLSGPLTESLGARLAVYGSDTKGYFYDRSTPSANTGAPRIRTPDAQDFGGRLTLTFHPADVFDARFKFAYGSLRTSGPEVGIQTVACPSGSSQIAPGTDDCTANKTVIRPNPGVLLGAFDPDLAAEPFLKQDQILSGLEMNYDVASNLKLSSITGYYYNKTRFVTNFSLADTTFPQFVSAGGQRFRAEEVSQELRLSSDFGGPFDFMIGGYYQHSHLFYSNATGRNSDSPTPLGKKTPATQKGDAYSAFAQATYKLIETLELSAGGRYSYERKHFSITDAAGVPLTTANPQESWSNFSPEVTLSWRPTSDLTVYGGYKTGFLSGGFNVGAGDLTTDRSYDQQVVRGFEGGVKANLLDRRLRGSLIAYRYITTGLQIVSPIVLPSGTPDQIIVNAGKSLTEGIEFESSFAVTPRFSVRGSIAYNRARYKKFVANCYIGQTPAEGCNLAPNAAGAFTAQDLAGKQILRAPDVVIQGGFTYEVPIADGQRISIGADGNYSSGFYGMAANKPAGRQDRFAQVDARIAYTDDDAGITVGLIGRNLTNRYVFYRSLDSTFTGGGTGTPAGRLADTLATVNPGREILLRVAFKLN